jgi:hypothetical protein
MFAQMQDVPVSLLPPFIVQRELTAARHVQDIHDGTNHTTPLSLRYREDAALKTDNISR